MEKLYFPCWSQALQAAGADSISLGAEDMAGHHRLVTQPCTCQGCMPPPWPCCCCCCLYGDAGVNSGPARSSLTTWLAGASITEPVTYALTAANISSINITKWVMRQRYRVSLDAGSTTWALTCTRLVHWLKNSAGAAARANVHSRLAHAEAPSFSIRMLSSRCARMQACCAGPGSHSQVAPMLCTLYAYMLRSTHTCMAAPLECVRGPSSALPRLRNHPYHTRCIPSFSVQVQGCLHPILYTHDGRRH